MTKKQKIDLETVKYFIPHAMKHVSITEKDIEMFFEWSEQGKHKNKVGGMPYKMDGFNALVQGKEWRGVHMGMWEEGVLDGSVPCITLLGGYALNVERKWYQFWKEKTYFVHNPIPISVVDFMKKEMFKGYDSKLIENVYNSLFE
jgi:hypothetical protein